VRTFRKRSGSSGKQGLLVVRAGLAIVGIPRGWRRLGEPSSISGPHVASTGIVQAPYLCADASRYDYADTTLAMRINLAESMMLSLGVFKALNDQRVRAPGWSPLASFEATL
jgi:hypothetical protein